MGAASRWLVSRHGAWAWCGLALACSDGTGPDGAGTRPEKIAFILTPDQRQVWIVDVRSDSNPGVATPIPQLLDSGGAGSIAWSPDGRFLVTAGDEGLSLIDTDSATINVILPNDSGFFDGVRWSRDGSRLAFERHTPGVGVGVWTARADGTGAVNASGYAAGTESLAPDLSPDGRYVTYMRNDPGTSRYRVWIAASDGSTARAIDRPGDAMHPRWSPADDLIAFHDRQSVWIIQSDGFGPRTVCGSGENLFPHWSGDGSRLIYYRAGSIYVTDVGGSECTKLADVAWPNVDWSRDDKRVVFTTNPGGGGHMALSTVNVETLVIIPIIQMPGAVFYPQWRP